MIDFDAYLRRIGLDPADKPAWQAVHRAHVTTIPFENLDPHRGIAVSLEQADLERELVASRRGGYCFEHNLLRASALAHMGLEVGPMLARARVGGAPRETRPATHLVLRVTDAGRQWQADAGFGLGTLLDPIPFGPASVREQSGWSFQVVEDGGRYATAMANFAVRLVHGPGWDPARPIRQQDGWDAHAAFMDGLVDDGFIILGGPVGEGNPPEETLHAVEAADEDEIRTRLARDPWARAGLLRVGSIEPWALWLDGRPVSQRPDQRHPPAYRRGCQPMERRRSHQGASGSARGSGRVRLR